jgi:CubicO group peptidase (beta-lactamase class C family)
MLINHNAPHRIARSVRYSSLLTTCIALIVAVSSIDAHAATAAPFCAKPVVLDDGWRVAEAREAGFDVALLCAAINEIDSPKNVTNTHAVIVERRGQLVAERYFTGSDRNVRDWFAREKSFTPNDLHDMRSISKSVVGLLIGIAREQGKIGALSTPIADFFPSHQEFITPAHRKITLEHLLTMSSGLEWDESGSGVQFGNNETRMSFAWDRERYVLSRPIALAPGTRWNYNGGSTMLLASALERVTATPLDQYAREKLFAPLGITTFEWLDEVYSKLSPYSGLRLRPRDLAKIGRLMANNGRWQYKDQHKEQYKQIVPAAWVEASMRAHINTEVDGSGGTGLGYGYQWWTGSIEHMGRNLAWVSGFGNGGQRLFIVRELDLVVVITAGRYNEPNNGRPSMALFRKIVAAVR